MNDVAKLPHQARIDAKNTDTLVVISITAVAAAAAAAAVGHAAMIVNAIITS
jgi:hypothetical protein